MGGRRKLILVSLIICVMQLFAQTDETTDSVAIEMQMDTSAVWVLPELFSDYDSTFSFIHFNEDTLYWGKDSMNLVRFYQKWNDVIQNKRGNVHIMHIGGSHVQAGTMSHRIRKHVLAEYDGEPADRGLIFPIQRPTSATIPAITVSLAQMLSL